MTSTLLSCASSSADALIAGRVVKATTKTYALKVAAIEQFYIQQELDFTLPLRVNDILSFFGWLIETKPKPKPLAFSSVRSYKSALLWYYKEKRVVMEPEVNQQLEQSQSLCCHWDAGYGRPLSLSRDQRTLATRG